MTELEQLRADNQRLTAERNAAKDDAHDADQVRTATECELAEDRAQLAALREDAATVQHLRSVVSRIEDGRVAGADLSDAEVAGKVRMMTARDLDHELVCTLARDRIIALSTKVHTLTAENERLRSACIKTESDIQQIIGKALGFMWYKDDQVNFPGATETNGVFTGEHVAETMADLAAGTIIDQRAQLAAYAEAWTKMHHEQHCQLQTKPICLHCLKPLSGHFGHGINDGFSPEFTNLCRRESGRPFVEKFSWHPLPCKPCNCVKSLDPAGRGKAILAVIDAARDEVATVPVDAECVLAKAVRELDALSSIGAGK